MTYPFVAKVHFYDDEWNDKPRGENFVSFASSFSEAMEKVERVYGNDLADVFIELWGESEGLLVSDETLAQLRNTHY